MSGTKSTQAPFPRGTTSQLLSSQGRINLWHKTEPEPHTVVSCKKPGVSELPLCQKTCRWCHLPSHGPLRDPVTPTPWGQPLAARPQCRTTSRLSPHPQHSLPGPSAHPFKMAAQTCLRAASHSALCCSPFLPVPGDTQTCKEASAL